MNKRILLTKSYEEAWSAMHQLVDEGAEIIFFPTLKINPIYESPELTEVLNQFQMIDYIVLTSRNAAEIFNSILEKYSLDISSKLVAAVGTGTAQRCGELGIEVNLIPDEFSASGLIKKFSGINILGKNIFVPCSSLSREELKIGLAELGAIVHSVPVYNVESNDEAGLNSEIEQIKIKKPDIFIFTSPSSFWNFLDIMKIKNPVEYFSNAVLATIGSTTEKSIIEAGVNVNIVPSESSLPGICNAVIKYFQITYNIA